MELQKANLNSRSPGYADFRKPAPRRSTPAGFRCRLFEKHSASSRSWGVSPMAILNAKRHQPRKSFFGRCLAIHDHLPSVVRSQNWFLKRPVNCRPQKHVCMLLNERCSICIKSACSASRFKAPALSVPKSTHFFFWIRASRAAKLTAEARRGGWRKAVSSKVAVNYYNTRCCWSEKVKTAKWTPVESSIAMKHQSMLKSPVSCFFVCFIVEAIRPPTSSSWLSLFASQQVRHTLKLWIPCFERRIKRKAKHLIGRREREQKRVSASVYDRIMVSKVERKERRKAEEKRLIEI